MVGFSIYPGQFGQESHVLSVSLHLRLKCVHRESVAFTPQVLIKPLFAVRDAPLHWRKPKPMAFGRMRERD